MTAADPRLRPLRSARPLAHEEAELLRTVLRLHGMREDRVDIVRVVASCTCGCPSLGLKESSVGPVAEGVDHQEYRANAEGIDVVVHTLGGRVCELEIWDGEPGDTPLPAPHELTRT